MWHESQGASALTVVALSHRHLLNGLQERLVLRRGNVQLRPLVLHPDELRPRHVTPLARLRLVEVGLHSRKLQSAAQQLQLASLPGQHTEELAATSTLCEET